MTAQCIKARAIRWQEDYILDDAKNKKVALFFEKNGFVGGKRFNCGIAIIDGSAYPIQYNNDLSLKNKNNQIIILEGSNES